MLIIIKSINFIAEFIAIVTVVTMFTITIENVTI